jgi:hypothetical protein
MFAKDEHSSLFHHSNFDKEIRKFYNIDTKVSMLRNLFATNKLEHLPQATLSNQFRNHTL